MENKKKDKNYLGLALSGGGYRAATYHIGTFRALRKLNVLDKINAISTNSGGSIAGACYSINHQDFDKFENILVKGVQKSVIGRLIKTPRFFIPVLIMLGIIAFSLCLFFTSYAWLNIIIGPAFIIAFLYGQYEILPISRIIEKIYDDVFYQRATLGDLSPDFETVINSTNLDTGRLFHFSKEKMGDSKYKDPKAFENDHLSFPVSKAVMASSCVPFAFTPVKIPKKYFKNLETFRQIKPRLVDGGVYDNQGIHKLTFIRGATFCKNVIVSDAGTNLPFENNYRNMFTLLVRTSSVFMARIKNLQKMNSVHSQPLPNESTVAYQSLGDDLEDALKGFVKGLQQGHISAEAIAAHQIPQQVIDKDWNAIRQLISEKMDLEKLVTKGCTPEELQIARSVSTNLTPLTKAQTEALIKHAEAVTEIKVRLYLPHIL